MESDRETLPEPGACAAAERASGTGGGPEPRPVFWKEIYWFALISLGGWILAVLVLSPRLERDRSTRDVEENLREATARLATLERQYEAAIQAVENDPFYREEVIRAVLKVKRQNEEFLKVSAGISDN